MARTHVPFGKRWGITPEEVENIYKSHHPMAPAMQVTITCLQDPEQEDLLRLPREAEEKRRSNREQVTMAAQDARRLEVLSESIVDVQPRARAANGPAHNQTDNPRYPCCVVEGIEGEHYPIPLDWMPVGWWPADSEDNFQTIAREYREIIGDHRRSEKRLGGKFVLYPVEDTRRFFVMALQRFFFNLFSRKGPTSHTGVDLETGTNGAQALWSPTYIRHRHHFCPSKLTSPTDDSLLVGMYHFGILTESGEKWDTSDTPVNPGRNFIVKKYL